MGRTGQCLSFQPGQWVKGKVIGCGSYGTVHLAMDKATGSLFVAKSAHSASSVQSLMNEANTLERLDSPYIVRCLGRNVSKGSNGESKGNIFLEYMAGGSLKDVADKFGGSLDEEVIGLYTREILYGLKHLHEKGIVHCDLKCKNVLLGSTGNIKLADFGCAKRLNKEQKRNGSSAFSWQSVGGTPLWMAPEVLRKERLEFASDIWSLGCTVIEMATGRPPWDFEVSNPMAAILKIACTDEKPKFPIHFSREGLDFLARCLEKNPDRRWTAEELLAHPFISTGHLQKKCASSPASVFEIPFYEEAYDPDDSEIPDDIEYLCMQPERTRMAERQQAAMEFDSAEDWITVRSGRRS